MDEKVTVYEDLLVFMEELCGRFRMLADPEKGLRLITSASLKKNCEHLGLEGMTEEDAVAMVKEGDLDGDGALNEMDFCVLMIRLSPEMMKDAVIWLEKAIQEELHKYHLV